MMDRYTSRTTAQKLGICAGAKVAVIDARDYARVIGSLPENVEFDEESWDGCAVTLWFGGGARGLPRGTAEDAAGGSPIEIMDRMAQEGRAKGCVIKRNSHSRDSDRTRLGGL